MPRALLLAAALLCPAAAVAADLSWITEHALRPHSDVVEDLQQHVTDAINDEQNCVIQVGEGLLDTPALLMVEDGRFHPRPLRSSEAETLELEERRVGVRCQEPVTPGTFRAALGDPPEGVYRLRPGERISGTIAIELLEQLRGKLTLALVIEGASTPGNDRHIFWQHLEDPGGEAEYDFGPLDLAEEQEPAIVIAELVLCLDREPISNRVPLILVLTMPRSTDPDHA